MASANYPATQSAPDRRTARSCTLASRFARFGATSPLYFARRPASPVSAHSSASLCAGAEELHRQCFASVSQSHQHDPAAFDRQCFRQAAQSRQFPCLHEGAARQWHGNQHHCFRFGRPSGRSQLARRSTAIPRPMVSARLRIVLAGQRGIRCSCGTRTLRAPASPPFGFT